MAALEVSKASKTPEDARFQASSLTSGPSAPLTESPRGLAALQAKNVSASDWSLFYGSLATMLQAGVGISSAFFFLAEGGQNRRLAAISKAISKSLSKGRSLHLACSAPEFKPLHLAMIKIGEETGNLPLILSRLADFEKSQARVQLALRSALIYPLALLSLILLLGAIVPAFFQKPMSLFFHSLGLELPFAWTVVFQISSVLSNQWFWLGGLAFCLIYWQIISRPLLSGPLQGLAGRFFFGIPRARKVVQPIFEQRLASALAITLEARLPDISILLVGDTLSNPLLKKACGDISQSIRKGSSLPAAFEKTGVFSPTLLAFVELGDETGDLPVLLRSYADLLSLTIEEDLKAALSLLQPLFLLFLALVVLSIAVGVVGPLSQVLQTL